MINDIIFKRITEELRVVKDMETLSVFGQLPVATFDAIISEYDSDLINHNLTITNKNVVNGFVASFNYEITSI